MFRICCPGEIPPSPFFGDSDKPLQGNYAGSAEHSLLIDNRAQFLKTVSSVFMTKTDHGLKVPETPDELLKIVQEVVEDALDTLDLGLLRRCRPRVTGIALGGASTNALSLNQQCDKSIGLPDDDYNSGVDESVNMLDGASRSFFTDATHFSFGNTSPNLDSNASGRDKANDDKAGSGEAGSKELDDPMLGIVPFMSGAFDSYTSDNYTFNDYLSTGNDFRDTLRSSSVEDHGTFVILQK